MAEINEIISPKAIEGILAGDKALSSLDETLIKFLKNMESANSAIAKNQATTENLSKAYKQTNEAEKEAVRIKKEQDSAAKALDKQRVQSENVLKKQLQKEAEYEHILKSQSTSIETLRAKNKALRAERDKVDTSTKEGIKNIKSLNAQIDKNNAAIEKNTDKLTKQKTGIGRYKEAVSGVIGAYVAATAALAGFFRLISKSVQAYDEEAKAQTKLLTALKGRKDIQERLIIQASQLQKITLFGDEATVEAQAMLAAMGLNEDAIKRLTPLVQDLATKDNMDLVSSAQMIAKSVGSSTNALSRYGITIEGAVGSAERLDSAVKNLNEKVGGQAIAAAKVGSGAVTTLSNAWGDLLEKLGAAVANPATIALINKLTDLLSIPASQKEIKLFGDNGVVQEAGLATRSVEQIGKELEKLQKDQKLYFENWKNSNGEQRAFWAGQYDIAKENISIIEKHIENQKTVQKQETKIVEESTKELSIREQILEKIKKEAEYRAVMDALISERNAKNGAITPIQSASGASNIATNPEAELLNQSVDLFKEAEQKKTLTAEEEQAKRLEIAQNAVQALGAIGDTIFEMKQTALTQESEAIAKQKAYELELAGNNQEKINAINLKYAKKEAELKNKQAKADHQAAIFKGIQNLALGIVSMFQAGPAGIALAAVTAALGAVQLGVIATTPVPQFAKGTKSAPKGLMQVGEKGRELIETGNGFFMANKPTIVGGIEGARIYSNKETERLMQGRDRIGVNLQPLLASNKELISTVRNKTEWHYSAEKRELTARKGDYWQKYKNVKLH